MLDAIGRHEYWHFYTPDGGLSAPAEQAALVAAVHDLEAEVIVADPLLAAWPVADENDNAIASRQMDVFRWIARATSTRVVLLHHQGEGNVKAKFRARGATARVDRCDLAMNLDEVADDVRRLTIVKSRFGTLGQSLRFKFGDDLGYEPLEDAGDLSPSAYAAAEARVLAVVTGIVAKKDIGARLPDVPERTLNEVLRRLVTARKLLRCGPDGGAGKGHYQPAEVRQSGSL
jgi:hypothetical protein